MWLLAGSLALVFTVATSLPSGWKTCSKSSPDFIECLRKDIQQAMVDLRDGNEELGVSPLEPYLHPKTKIEMAPGFDLFMINTYMHGMTMNTIDKLEVEPWKDLKVWMHTENMNYTFTYTFKGKFLNFEVDSSGDAIADLMKVKTEVNVTFDEFEKSGKSYLKVKDISLHYIPESVYIHFEPHDKKGTFGEAMNRLLNENWRTLYKTSVKSGDNVLEHILENVINHVLERIPLEDFDIP